MRRNDDRASFETKANLHEIGNSIEGKLEARRLASFRELVDVGEFGVALENLCANLADDEIPLNPSTRKKILDLCALLALDPKYASLLGNYGEGFEQR